MRTDESRAEYLCKKIKRLERALKRNQKFSNNYYKTLERIGVAKVRLEVILEKEKNKIPDAESEVVKSGTI